MANPAINSPSSIYEAEKSNNLNHAMAAPIASGYLSQLSPNDSQGHNPYITFDPNQRSGPQFQQLESQINHIPPPMIPINYFNQMAHEYVPSANPNASAPFVRSSYPADIAFHREQNLANQPQPHCSFYSDKNSVDSNMPNNENFLCFQQANNQMFHLDFESTCDLLNDVTICDNRHNFLYSTGDLSFDNASFESIPEITREGEYKQFTDSTDNFGGQSQISNRSDTVSYSVASSMGYVHTPTFTDASCFTPNSTVNEEFTTPGPVMAKSSNASNSNVSLLSNSHKIMKKSSITRLSNCSKSDKKGGKKTAKFQGTTLPLSQSLPQLSGTSPISRYKIEFNDKISSRSLSASSNSTRLSLTSTFSQFPDSNISFYPQCEVLQSKRKNTSFHEVGIQKSTNQQFPNSSNQCSMPQYSNDDPNTGKAKKYTRRRLLPRSKNGCWICRIKHLKCDEARPICASCSKFGIECDYSPEKPAYVSDKNLKKEKLLSISLSRKQQTDGKDFSKFVY